MKTLEIQRHYRKKNNGGGKLSSVYENFTKQKAPTPKSKIPKSYPSHAGYQQCMLPHSACKTQEAAPSPTTPQTQTEKGKAEPGNRVKQAPHKIPGHWGGNVPEGGNCVPMEILLHSLGSAAEQ